MSKKDWMNQWDAQMEKEEKKYLKNNINEIVKAIDFFEWAKDHRGRDSMWSIQYYGFGEHLTHWSGDGTFLDFNIDKGQGISWNKMKSILIESANNLREAMKEEYEERKKAYTPNKTNIKRLIKNASKNKL